METSIFNSIVFGPIKSRRLGISLGINLLPIDGKLCSFDCIYCECGLNEERHTLSTFPSFEDVEKALNVKLKQMKEKGEYLDVITFAGNGEPTLHPKFFDIIDMTLKLRNLYYPNAKISVLSNATMLHKTEVIDALKKVDNNIQKLDGADDDTIRLLNRPNNPDFSLKKLIKQLKSFNGNVIIQSIFLQGEIDNVPFDNSSDDKIYSWLTLIEEIKPKEVMVYTIDRPTPLSNLKKISLDRLLTIADRVKSLGIKVSVAG